MTRDFVFPRFLSVSDLFPSSDRIISSDEVQGTLFRRVKPGRTSTSAHESLKITPPVSGETLANA